MVRPRPIARCVANVTLALVLDAGRVPAQSSLAPPTGLPSATIAAGARYQAGTFRRFFLGDNYRDLWATPITVPVLDLRTFAGGLTPTGIGGSKQTRSLAFDAANGDEFVFRLVDKDGLNLPVGYEHTIVESFARDQVSALHPAGAMVSDVLLTAAGVLHPNPMLAVMPDDSLLGTFREDFAGRLGLIELNPSVPDSSAGFGGAVEIIDSDSLATLLDAYPREQVDARAYLKARLVDMLVNDWDRHSGNWKWARMESDGLWQPIARDRDRVMTTYDGLPGTAVAGEMMPQLIRFDMPYARMSGLTWNSIDLDRRLLSGLEASTFDSVAVDLASLLTDAVIDSALRAMPREYDDPLAEASARLKSHRDQLPEQAGHFYKLLAEVVDIHATDAADSVTVTLVDEHHVDVEIRSGTGEPYFRRRFDDQATRQLRLYLHGGDDHAEVRGNATPTFPIRVIGGNGTNDLIKTSQTASTSGNVKFYDEGTVTDVPYGKDPTFDRQPWVREKTGTALAPGRDWGSGFSPAAKMESLDDELGLIAALGVSRKSYAFGTYPYSNRARLVGEYSLGVQKFRVLGDFDKRWEETPLHVTVRAHWSQMEIINFYGLGNDTKEVLPEAYYDAPHRQWMVYPALAYVVGPRSDITIGPVFKYSSTDTAVGHYVSDTKPYGIGDFGQVGLRLGIYKDSRIRQTDAYRGLLLDMSATVYPAVLDVTSQFEVYSLATAAYFTFPVIKRPFVSLKAGASQVHGDFPFHEAAFVGGEPSERKLPHERYAGDAAVYGSAELRIPVVGFAFILPIDIGAYVYGNAGRVYVDRLSPEGWHSSRGAGMWIGVLNPSSGIDVDLGNYVGRNIVQAKIGFSF
jgi:hypothetical protein